MKITHKILPLLCFISLSAQATERTHLKPSSAIPERREFPLNEKISPCEDFHKYVCSKVENSFVLREDRSSHTFAFNDSSERILEKKKEFFLNLGKTKPESEREAALKDLYLGCMNPRASRHAEEQEVKRVLRIAESWKTREDVMNFFAEAYTNTEHSPIRWGATNNFDKPTVADLALSADWTSLPEKTYYKDEKLMKDFADLVRDFFKTIKYPDIKEATETVLKFEKELAEILPTPEQWRQIWNSRSYVDKKELLKKYPNLQLEKLFGKVPEATLVRFMTPEGFDYVYKFLQTASIEEIKRLFVYSSLNNVLDDSAPLLFKKGFDFQKKYFGGPEKRPERHERCTRFVSRSFTKEVDSILMPRLFPNFDKEKFIHLAEKVRGSILESLKENKWLSSDARKAAIKKITVAKLKLVSPNNEKEWDFWPLQKYDPKQPIANKKLINQMRIDREFRDLREGIDPDRWDYGPLLVNASYYPSENKFVMPLGILQYPFYDAKLSDEENLAAVGSVIGHELGHGVDDQGSKYDFEGKQNQWMSMKDLKGFSDRTEKLITQFQKAGMNGRLTLGENIGDLVGVTASYQAAAKNPEFLKNPELQKKYFVAYGRVWCNKARPKAQELQVKTDPHSLGRVRINEQVRQQPGFKQVFQCKNGDPMTLPESDLVKIW